MDPHGYHEIPEDVAEDLKQASERQAKLDDMLATARERNKQQRAQAVEQASKPVMVSVAPGSGKIRRNGPCPCGSRKKFKKCCLGKVRDGELDQVRHSGLK